MATTRHAPNTVALPPYLPFATFQAAIQNLRTHGLPDKLDKTAWDSRSGGEQKMIIGAFRFLSLIDTGDNVQTILHRLVDTQENSDDEKILIQTLLQTAYPSVFRINLKTASMGAVEGAIGALGVSGTTRDRAVRFFIKASQHCGIELSSRLTMGIRSRTSGMGTSEDADASEAIGSPISTRPRRRRRMSSDDDAPEDRGDIPTNAVKTISLNVGELTLSGTFNPFELEGPERKLVYDIIDLMKKHQQGTKAT